MKAICTKFLGPTANKPGRIKAWEMDGKSLTMSVDAVAMNLGHDDAHARVARMLADMLGWTADYYGELVSGGVKGGMVHVFTGVRK